jgi:hypothetical protein
VAALLLVDQPWLLRPLLLLLHPLLLLLPLALPL